MITAARAVFPHLHLQPASVRAAYYDHTFPVVDGIVLLPQEAEHVIGAIVEGRSATEPRPGTNHEGLAFAAAVCAQAVDESLLDLFAIDVGDPQRRASPLGVGILAEVGSLQEER
jgi:hypothetical protein